MAAGQLAGDPGLKSNFGFNVKYNKSGTNLQGNVNVIDRSGGRVYQFKSNSILSLTLASATHATFTGKANVQDITDPNNPISVDGNATLQMDLYDNGSGSTDTIALTILNKNGGLYYANAWNGTQTVQQPLGGGNLQVIPAQFLAGARAVGLPAPSPLTLSQLQPIVAEAAARWRAAGIDPPRRAALDRLTFRIADLPGNDLGMEAEGVITLDRTADGYGWFVDPTPGEDSEFAPGAVDSPARGHVDLLSVVAHEMGHVLGYFEDSDAAGTVMSEDLPLGVRHVPVPREAARRTVPALAVAPAEGRGVARVVGASANGASAPAVLAAEQATDYVLAAGLLAPLAGGKLAGVVSQPDAADAGAKPAGGPPPSLLTGLAPARAAGSLGATIMNDALPAVARPARTDVLDSLFARSGDPLAIGLDD